jgi:hypothetical protein
MFVVDSLKIKIQFILFPFFICTHVTSQTIVNTYDLITPIDSVWSATTELQCTFAAGNGVFTALNSGLGLGRSINSSTQIWFLGGYNYASESGNAIYSTGFINLRAHRTFEKRIQLQVFYQNQFNSALEILERNLVGLNFAKAISTEWNTYKFTVGAFNENEIYSDQSRRNLVRGNVSTSVTADFREINVNLTLYYQPTIVNFNDYRMLGELALQFPVSKQLVFEIESALRFDSDPHLDLLPLDFSTLIGMVYTISN